MSLEVHQYEALSDNYNYLIHCSETGATIILDPSEAANTLRHVENLGWKVSAIWNTHHHFDHIGGNLALKQKLQIPIYGPDYDRHRIPGIDHCLRDGDGVGVGKHEAQVLFLPGHTTGHIAFYFEREKKLFSGDVLFAMGCGRMFEGTPEEYVKTLAKVKRLPEDTRVYCAHEYTLKNAQFALTVDPQNENLLQRYSQCEQLREQDRPTVPFKMREELSTNPFLRLDNPAWSQRLQVQDSKPESVFAALRSLRDDF